MEKWKLVSNEIERLTGKSTKDFLHDLHIVKKIPVSEIQRFIARLFNENNVGLKVGWSMTRSVLSKNGVNPEKQRPERRTSDKVLERINKLEKLLDSNLSEFLNMRHNSDRVTIESIAKELTELSKEKIRRGFILKVMESQNIPIWNNEDIKAQRIESIEKTYNMSLKELINHFHNEKRLCINEIAAEFSEKTGEVFDEGFVRYHAKRLGVEVWKTNMSEHMTKRNRDNWEKPEYRKHISNCSRSWWDKPGNREKMREMSLELWKTPSHRKLIAKRLKELWGTEEYAEKMLSTYKERRTKIEIAVEDMLKKLGIEYKEQEPLISYDYFVIPDFLIGNKVIEVNGDYWHANPEKYDYSNLTEIQEKNVKRDEKKVKIYESLGIELLVLWEHDIKRNPEDVFNKIKDFM